MTVRVGVVGTGWWATRAHLPALEAHPDAAIAAIADPSDGNRARAAERFGVGRAYSDAVDMLAAEELDAAVIATPHATHAALARACLERGLHVLVEKPMTLDPADAFGLVDLARSVGRELIVGYPWHYNRQALALRDAIGEGAIGPVESASVLFASIVRELYRGRPESYRDVLGYTLNAPGDSTYSDPAIAGGGQGQTQLTHSSALLLWLTGLVPAAVSALTANFELAVDLADAVAVRFEGGAVASLAATGNVLPGQDEILEIRIFGPDGHIVWDVDSGSASIHGHGGAITELPGLEVAERYPEAAPVGNLVGVALGRESNGSPGEIGARTVALIDAMYRAARAGTQVAITAVPATAGRET
jgi:predicted dehydrogenase